ncbi:MAG: ABC transporter ATP-binding protein [Firmicutes bacterium]|nr:ABC transporter ATP-binding protein [Bacillota bacterium]
MPEATSALLEVRDISVSAILHHMHLTIGPGEIVALIGPNGAGKSTFLRACAHVTPIKSGEVLLCGRPLASYRARARARLLGFLPQQTSIEVPYSVRDVVELGAYARKGGLSPSQTDDILEHVGLQAFASRDVRTLSGGERQRALIGKVLAQDARLLLLDEPVSGLDVSYQWDIMQICKGFVTDGQRSVLITLHDLELVLQYADRAVLLHQGRILMEGAPEVVLTGPALQEAFGVQGNVFADPVTGIKRLSLTRTAPSVR